MKNLVASLISFITAFCILSQDCFSQSAPELLDKRFAFDPSVKDQARIISFINRIETEERSVEARLVEVTKNQSELQTVVTQVRAIPPSRLVAVPTPAILADLIRMTDSAEKLKALRAALPALNTLASSVRDREAALASVRQLGTGRFRDSALFGEAGQRIVQRIIALGGGRCTERTIADVIELAKDQSEK